ncbi:hypothetical protein C9975_06720 [Thalassospira xiamenensis]|nr:hypothetical protein C9975_06720 [Thalassospira xiamenensis]
MRISDVKVDESNSTVAVLFNTKSRWLEAKALEIKKVDGKYRIILDRLIEEPERLEAPWRWELSGDYVSELRELG